jgi:tRNA1(Val) A37 N6-methylase TrmN6
METTQIRCTLEVKSVLQKTFTLLSDGGRFVLIMKKRQYTAYITSAKSLNNVTACALIINVSTVKGHRAIWGV